MGLADRRAPPYSWLLAVLVVGAGCGQARRAPNERDVERAVAALKAHERTFIDASPEEFQVELERRLAWMDTIRSALEASEAGETSAREDWDERRARIGSRLLELTLDATSGAAAEAGEGAERDRLVRASEELERDLVAAWSARGP